VVERSTSLLSPSPLLFAGSASEHRDPTFSPPFPFPLSSMRANVERLPSLSSSPLSHPCSTKVRKRLLFSFFPPLRSCSVPRDRVAVSVSPSPSLLPCGRTAKCYNSSTIFFLFSFFFPPIAPSVCPSAMLCFTCASPCPFFLFERKVEEEIGEGLGVLFFFLLSFSLAVENCGEQRDNSGIPPLPPSSPSDGPLWRS